MNLRPSLRRFASRVRVVRAWVGLSIGLSVGAILATIWAALDWMNVLYAEWPYLAWLVGICGFVGLIAGAVRRIASKDLADSIDRRAKLQNRLATASERVDAHGVFDEALREDATKRLEGLSPARLFPVRFGRWQAGAVLFSILAASIFLLGNTPLLMSKGAAAARAKMQKQAAEIEHVLKPIDEEAKKGNLDPAEKKLTEDLRKLANDLKKARMDPEQAMQRQNELTKQSQKLSDQRFQKADQSMQTAQSAFKQMQKDALDKMQMDPSQMQMSMQEMQQAKDAISKMSPEDMQKAMDLMQQKANLEQQLQNPKLSPKAKKALQEKLDEISKMLANMHLSEAVQKMLQRMMNDPLWKEIQKAMQKLAEKEAELQKLLQHAKNEAKSGQQNQLTKEQLQEMQKQLEEMAKQLASDKAMHQYLQQLLDALKSGQLGQDFGMGGGIGLKPMELPGAGGPSRDLFFANTGFINKGKGEKSQGTTYTTAIRGQSREVPGQSSYIEIRGPSMTGLRSSIPYQKVLPSYRRKADEAMNRQEIPPEHQKRVKKYFESLGQ